MRAAAFVAHALVHVGDGHYAIAFIEGKRAVDDCRDSAERHDADRDSDGHADDANDREARIFREHANAKPEVERQSVEPRESTSVAKCLLVLRDTAERDARAAPRLRGIEAFLADEALGFHFYMEADLL